MIRRFFLPVVLVVVLLSGFLMRPVNEGSKPLYPSDILITTEKEVLLGCEGSRDLRMLDKEGRLLKRWEFDGVPTGVAVQGEQAWVTWSDQEGGVAKVDIRRGRINWERALGQGARGPRVSRDGKTVYVAERFLNRVVKLDAGSGKLLGEVEVVREPFDMEISRDGRYLFVNNFLPDQRADASFVAAAVSVIDLSTFTCVKNIRLSNGSNALRGICTTPDGRYVLVTHNLGRFQVPTSQLEQGWMNTSGLSVLDAERLELIATVVLDEPERGAAGSWGIGCTDEHIVVVHSGTHDLSVIDLPRFIEKLIAEPDKAALAYNLRFLSGLRSRHPLRGNGPRALAINGSQVIIPTYFSGDLNIFDLSNNELKSFSLNPDRIESDADAGRRIFNDATHCFQGWQSCNGCHPGDARTDGLNWDLLNDGIGNPKNCKSLLFAHETPPAMVSGIRGSAEVAVRAGFTHIQFTNLSEDDALKVDAYLRSLEPVGSPYLIKGRLSPAARKGAKIFAREGCGTCHSGEYFTDLKSHRIGDVDSVAPNWKGWDTPTLREVWRTGPYLFDGRAADMESVFSEHRHGIEQPLSELEISQLTAYVLSL